MTITFTEKEFFDLVEKIRRQTVEDTLDSAWTEVSMSPAQAEKIRRDVVSAKARSPYSYLLKYNGQI